MLTLNDGRSELWQWDTNRTLTVDADCSQVHFSNKVFGRSIDVDVVDGVASIPDILLQTDKELTAWAFVGTAENGYTKISKVFKVNKRNKPADYVFTPQEQTTLQQINDRLDEVQENSSKEAISKRVEEYLEENPIEVPVQSVNRQIGDVMLYASDVMALPEDTFIPEKTSDLTNDSGFITKIVNDLENYYTKQTTYSREEIDAKVSSIPKFSIRVVSSLPTTNISNTTVYLVGGGDGGDLYTEYIYVNGNWEILGSQRVDLTGYATEEWVNVQLGQYIEKTELPNAINVALAQAKESGDFDGPKGDTGEQGIQGEAGPAGPQGIQGERGAKGEKGETGATGSQGERGPQGVQGIQGDPGIQGIRGEQGPQGIQGPQGPEGPRGIPGVAVQTAGYVAFNVTEDGILQCTYSGEEPPNYSINNDGHLILEI